MGNNGHNTKSLGDLKSIIREWRRSYGAAAQRDRGARLLGRRAGEDWRTTLRQELSIRLLNVGYSLLEEGVPLWGADTEPVSTASWLRIRRYLSRSRYGAARGRYLLRFEGPGSPSPTLDAHTLGGKAGEVRLSSLYSALSFTSVAVTDRRRAWTPAAVRRVGRALLAELQAEHVLEVNVSADEEILHLFIRTDHDTLEPDTRIRRYAEAAVRNLEALGFSANPPERIAANAARIPIRQAPRRRNSAPLRPALIFLPPESRHLEGIAIGDSDLLLLPTVPVFEPYGQVFSREPTRPFAAAVQEAGATLLSLEDLLREQNRRGLLNAARQIAKLSGTAA